MAVKHLTTQEFKDQIFDYTNTREFKFAGSKPTIIDFYASWCGPCKMVAPILEELSVEYADKVDIFKVDTEAEEELSAVFGIQSIPTFLFIPAEGEPYMQPGALQKRDFKKIIEEHLLPKASA